MKIDSLFILYTGLCYEIYSHVFMICSFPSIRFAMRRAHEIIDEFGLSYEVIYKHL